MTRDGDLDDLLVELQEELAEYAVPVGLVPAWVRGAFPDHDEASAIDTSMRICELLLGGARIRLVWMEGSYGTPMGTRPLDRDAPANVTPDMLTAPPTPADAYLALASADT